MDRAFRKISSFFHSVKVSFEKYLWPSFDRLPTPHEVESQIFALPKPIREDYKKTLQKRVKSEKNKRNVIFIGSFILMVANGWWVPFAGGLFYLWYAKEHIQKRLTQKVLYHTLQKHHLLEKSSSMKPVFKGQDSPIKSSEGAARRAHPRPQKITYDPANLTIENLQPGFLLDYELKTWKVTKHEQFDWDNHKTVNAFSLMHSIENRTLFVEREGDHLNNIIADSINIYAIDAELETEILLRSKPRNIIQYQEKTYYRDEHNDGYCFNLNDRKNGQRVSAWNYYDQERKHILIIHQIERKNFKAFKGMLVSHFEFSSILPSSL